METRDVIDKVSYVYHRILFLRTKKKEFDSKDTLSFLCIKEPVQRTKIVPKCPIHPVPNKSIDLSTEIKLLIMDHPMKCISSTCDLQQLYLKFTY